MKQIIIILSLSPVLGYSQNSFTDGNQPNRTIVIKNNLISDSVALSKLVGYGLGDEVKFGDITTKDSPKENLIPIIPKIDKNQKQIIYEYYDLKGNKINKPFIFEIKKVETKKIEPSLIVEVSKFEDNSILIESKTTLFSSNSYVIKSNKSFKKANKKWFNGFKKLKNKRFKKSSFGCYKF